MVEVLVSPHHPGSKADALPCLMWQVFFPGLKEIKMNTFRISHESHMNTAVIRWQQRIPSFTMTMTVMSKLNMHCIKNTAEIFIQVSVVIQVYLILTLQFSGITYITRITAT